MGQNLFSFFHSFGKYGGFIFGLAFALTPLMCLAQAQPTATEKQKSTEHLITQEGKNFSPNTVEAKVGDTLRFVNNDSVAHNVFSKSGVQDFNLKIQKPGESNIITLDAPGEFEVRCAIHPKMLLKVTVSK